MWNLKAKQCPKRMSNKESNQNFDFPYKANKI